MIKDERILDVVFESIITLDKEDEYYVIMMAGWLLSECIIRYQDKTLDFIKDDKLNYLIVNKAIQKCRESRRVSIEQKESLLLYKRKKDK